MRLVIATRSDVGRVRDGNEDAYLVDEALGLVALADGMGGHQAGEVASATALDALQAAMRAGENIKDAIAAANTAVIEKSSDDEDLRGMGTTITAGTVVDADTLLLGHVGDSRAYVVRDGELRQVTEDHSLVEELVRDGQLTPEQAQVHPQRSVITRALGIDPMVEIDTYPLALRTGDRVLFCSDGLTDMVRVDTIAAILRGQPDPEAAADELVDAANLAGGGDNITVVLVDVETDGDDTATFVTRAAAAAATTTAVHPVVDRGGAGPADGGAKTVAEDVTAPSAVDDDTRLDLGIQPYDPDDAGDRGGDRDPDLSWALADTAVDGDDAADGDVVVAETVVEDEVEPAPSRREARAQRREQRRADKAAAAAAAAPVSDDEYEDDDAPRRSSRARTTFRVLGWVLPVLLVLALAFGAVGWYARRTYFVSADGTTLVIYKGVPGGLLGWDPTVEETTDVRVEDLSEAELDDIGDGKRFSSLGKAEDYVERVETAADRRDASDSTTTTTRPTTPTTAAPPPP